MGLLEPTGGILGKAHSEGRFHTIKNRKASRAELKHSHYYRDPKGAWFKTCPECSRQAGKLTWHRLEEFSHRIMADGRAIPQSWCGPCRK